MRIAVLVAACDQVFGISGADGPDSDGDGFHHSATGPDLCSVDGQVFTTATSVTAEPVVPELLTEYGAQFEWIDVVQ